MSVFDIVSKNTDLGAYLVLIETNLNDNELIIYKNEARRNTVKKFSLCEFIDIQAFPNWEHRFACDTTDQFISLAELDDFCSALNDVDLPDAHNFDQYLDYSSKESFEFDVKNYIETIANFIVLAWKDIARLCDSHPTLRFQTDKLKRLNDKINDVCSLLNLELKETDNQLLLCPKDPKIDQIIDCVPTPIAFSLIEYKHFKSTSDLKKKAELLNKLSHYLEPNRQKYESINKDLVNLAFRIFNNYNIRHNNFEPSNNKNYKPEIAKLSPDELEAYYDLCFDTITTILSLEDIQNKKSKLFGDNGNK